MTMNRRAVRALLAVVFVGMLAAPVLVKRLSAPTAPGEAGELVGAAGSAYGFRLTEVSKGAGIDFTHRAPTLDAKLAPIMPEVASLGA